jgi:hypothetical protein
MTTTSRTSRTSRLHAASAPAASHPHRTATTLLRWVASFAGFPLGGLAAMLLVGPVDDIAPAIAGGLVTGTILGAAQGWALRLGRAAALRWVAATAGGLAVGLALGGSATSFGTTSSDLAVLGAVSGATVGLAQAVTLFRRLGAAVIAWPPYLAAVWALGWALTTSVGVDVERHWTVFGAAGAITAAALTTVLPLALDRRTR